MAIERLPNITTLAYYEFEVVLDDVEFKFEFRYNDRDDSWYMSIRAPDDTLLRMGLRIVNSWDILRLWVEASRPEGTVISVNQGEVLQPPTLEQLGAEVLLDYLDAEELEALA